MAAAENVEGDCPLLPVVGAEQAVPLVTGGESRYVNLDNAASTPALVSVAEHLQEVLPFYASVHRGAGYASQLSTSVYENGRRVVADFVAARPDDVVIFTRNTTDSIALLASAVPGETVYLDIEHHANLLPWLESGGRSVAAGGTIADTLLRIDRELADRAAALLTVTGASNVTGEVLPLRSLSRIAHRYGTRLAVDGAQLVPHRRVDLIGDGIDYLAFSGHKSYAPYGAGVLVGRRDWLDAAPAYLKGGGAVGAVSLDAVEWRSGAARHEAGSPNVLGVAALSRAIGELSALDVNEWYGHEERLRDALLSGLARLTAVRVHSVFSDTPDHVGVVSFDVEGFAARHVASYLSAEHGIGVRDGKFCAHPLLERLNGGRAALRASFGVGSRLADVTALLDALTQLLEQGPSWQYAEVEGQWRVLGDTRPRPEWAPVLEAGPDSYGCAA